MPGQGSGVRTDVDGALGNHGTVGLIDDAVDLLEVVRVRDDLVVGDDVLAARGLELVNLCLSRRHGGLPRPFSSVSRLTLKIIILKFGL